MFGRIQLYALLAFAFVAGMLGIYVSGVQRGIDRTKRKIDEKRLSSMKTAKEVEDEVEKSWMIPILLTGLTSGCAKISGDSYCDVVSPMYFGTDETVSWLIQNDRTLLVDIVVHNETAKRICGAPKPSAD